MNLTCETIKLEEKNIEENISTENKRVENYYL